MNFCSNCGQSMLSSDSWPRRCQECGRDHFKNPTPVVVVLLPVDSGVLAIRRAIPPAEGKLAFPGGFVDWGERWREAGAREVAEEIGIQIDPEELRLLGAESVPEGVLLLFAQANPRERRELDVVLDTTEVSEWLILNEPTEMAFSTHQDYLAQYFALRK